LEFFVLEVSFAPGRPRAYFETQKTAALPEPIKHQDKHQDKHQVDVSAIHHAAPVRQFSHRVFEGASHPVDLAFPYAQCRL
jgi:hypothetical protein